MTEHPENWIFIQGSQLWGYWIGSEKNFIQKQAFLFDIRLEKKMWKN